MQLRTRRWLKAIGIVAAVVVAVLLPTAAYAVHDLQFQLDGDVSASTTTMVGTTTQSKDWDSFFDATGSPISGSLTGGFTNSGFTKDFATNSNGSFNTADQTTFSTGSKDTLNITPGWQCNFDNNVNSKIDIMNAYALAYINPANNHEILYFALERNANTGDGNVAFWFLQDNASCVSTGPSQAWTGNHTDGDLLIVSAFTSGGGVSTIDVYRWNGGAGGSLGTTSVAHGADCKTTTGNDAVCATTNAGTVGITGSITTPWPTSNKQDGPGNTLRTAEFFEGGLDLTAKSLGGKCFNVFVADTRSSQSLTATLFDFARGTLGECAVTVTTTPSSTADRTLGSTDPITDTADVSGTTGSGGPGPTPTGNVTFFLCGPGVTTCPSGGTQVGSVAVTLGACNPAAVGHACATSVDAQSLLTAIGRYCFRAVYDPLTDPNYQGKGGSFDGSTECFNVIAVASISTEQRWLPNDKAIVTAPPGATVQGNVTWTLYVGSANCTTGIGVTTVPFGPTDVDSNGVAVTNNTTFYTSNQIVSWRATFHSTNGVLSGDPSHCETSSITGYSNDIGS